MAVDRCQIPFRLSPDHVKRLDKAARHCGQTRQAFVQTAVLAEIAEVEERQRMKQLRVLRRGDLPEPQNESDAPADSPVGMGIAAGIERRRESEEPLPPSANAPVVVNVGTAGGAASGVGSGDIIDRLAAYIVEVRDFERSARMRTAVRILHASASSPEERAALAKRLDDAVEARTTAKKSESGGLVKTARVAFDKIASIAGIFGGGDK